MTNQNKYSYMYFKRKLIAEMSFKLMLFVVVLSVLILAYILADHALYMQGFGGGVFNNVDKLFGGFQKM